MLQYLQLENKKQNYFFISQWITQCQHFSILLKIFGIIKNIANHPQLLKPERVMLLLMRVQFKIILKDQNYGFNYFIPYP